MAIPVAVVQPNIFEYLVFLPRKHLDWELNSGLRAEFESLKEIPSQFSRYPWVEFITRSGSDTTGGGVWGGMEKAMSKAKHDKVAMGWEKQGKINRSRRAGNQDSERTLQINYSLSAALRYS